jgi:hypothetical protein
MSKSLIDVRIEKLLTGLESTVGKLQDHEQRISHIESHMICDSRKRLNIRKRAEEQVRKILGPRQNNKDYNAQYRALIRQLWRDYWNAFGVTTYHDTPAMMYQPALEFIDNWVPRELRSLEETA